MPTWPSGLSYDPVRGTFSALHGRAPYRTEMEDGNQRARRRTTASVAQVQFELEWTEEEAALWDAFWESDLDAGSLEFDMPVYKRGVSGNFVTRTVFLRNEPTPKDAGVDRWRVQFQIDVRSY